MDGVQSVPLALRTHHRGAVAFGQHRHGPTADRFLEPFERRVVEEYERGGWLSSSTKRLNEALDQVTGQSSESPAAKPKPDSTRTAASG